MRSRKKSYTQNELENNPYIVKAPKAHKGQWYEYFGNKNKINLEIGTGKGSFLTQMAARETDINFLGIEKEKEIIAMAARNLAAAQVNNAALILAKAEELPEYFLQGQIAHIYLNFSDPWPKNGYAKRRLTHRDFLAIYEKLLAPGGRISLKTDQGPLFDFSLREFAAGGFSIISQTRDLHSTHYHLSGENIMTEYETKFAQQGKAIYRAEVGWDTLINIENQVIISGNERE